MAIQVLCPKCKSSWAVSAKSCGKCGTVFGRNRKYRVCVSAKGKRITRVVDNLTLAREAEPAIKADLLRGELDIASKPKPIPTLGEVWARYLAWAREHKKSWVDDLRRYRQHLEPRYGRKPLDAIAPLDLEKLKLDLKKTVNSRGKPYAAATIKHVMVIVRRLYNLARKWGLYSGKSPLESVSLPRLDNQKTEFLKEEELARLLDILQTWPCRESAAFVKFALFTGLRRGEMFKLTWEDVDFERGLITLRYPKGGRTETIPVNNEALAVLQELRKSQKEDSPFVFPGKDGHQRTDFNGPWRRIREAAGLPKDFRFHGLRHHFASALVSAGYDLLIVQMLLNHKDVKTTQRYAHLAPGALKAAAVKSGGILKPKSRREAVINLTE